MQYPPSPATSPILGARRVALALVLAVGAAGCDPAPTVQVVAADAYPERLSAWGLMERRGDRLVLGEGVTPYEVKTPLFSDYALKLRTWYLPPDTAMAYRPRDSFDFPVGSVISKTFFYPEHDGVAQAVDGWHGEVDRLDLATHRLVETRLLVRQADGWDALPYVWRGGDAYLKVTGDLQPLRLTVNGATANVPYVVPARSECASCHATDHTAGELELIGVRARHLHRPYARGEASQLEAWRARGALTGLPPLDVVPDVPAWDDPEAAVAERARAYLDSNCGHCHSPTGAADTSGLLLDAHTAGFRQLGYCKPPIAAGSGTGGRPYSIVPGQPDESILLFRMETDDPATRMPETGRSLSHREGVNLIRDWIAGMPGECV